MLSTVLMLCLIAFVSDITPGPNFWKIVHYSVFQSRRDALVFIGGLSTSSTIHCLLGFTGISALIASMEHGLTFIRLLGGAYIAWYGIKLLLSRATSAHRTATTQSADAPEANTPTDAGAVKASTATDAAEARPSIPSSFRRLWLDGLLTNFSNPKTILFYASLFALTLTPDKPPLQISVILACLLLTSFLTNLMIAGIFGLIPVQRFFRRWQTAINRVIGGLLFVAGIKIALQNRA